MLTKSELRQLSDTDLQAEVDKVAKEIIKFRMDLEGGYEKASHKGKSLRRYHARMLTVQRENQLIKK